MKSWLLAAAVLLTACSTPVSVRFGVHDRPAPIVAISNPSLSEGDEVAGRRAFIAAQCIDCHRVEGDPDLPRGRRSVAGPVLRDLRRYSARELATKITTRDTGASEELFDRTMKDYARSLTARQLVDIVTYLQRPRPIES